MARSVMKRYDADRTGTLDADQFQQFINDQRQLAHAERGSSKARR